MTCTCRRLAAGRWHTRPLTVGGAPCTPHKSLTASRHRQREESSAASFGCAVRGPSRSGQVAQWPSQPPELLTAYSTSYPISSASKSKRSLEQNQEPPDGAPAQLPPTDPGSLPGPGPSRPCPCVVRSARAGSCPGPSRPCRYRSFLAGLSPCPCLSLCPCLCPCGIRP